METHCHFARSTEQDCRTHLFLSKQLVPLFVSFLSPDSPNSPNIVMDTLASVPAPLLSPVYTVTLYLVTARKGTELGQSRCKLLPWSVPAVLCKKINDNYATLFFDNFKLCKIAPKFAIIMQTVQKYLQIMQILHKT